MTDYDPVTGEVLAGHDLIGAPDPVELTPTALVVRDGLSFEDWCDLGESLQRVEAAIQWWIGDWLNYGEWAYGEKYAQAIEITGFKEQRLMNYAWVAQNVTISFRKEILSWTHHSVVASRDPDEQRYWLDCAEREGWTVQQLRIAMRQQDVRETLIQSLPAQPAITHADAREWLATQPESCDLLLTDPPYSTDVEDIYAFAADWLPLALAAVKPTGRAFVCIGAYPCELHAYLSVKMPTQVLVWTYNNTIGPLTKMQYKQNWQAILYYAMPDAPALNGDRLVERFASQTINAPDGRHDGRYHAWEKPLKLAAQLVEQASQPDDLVYDPFAGTGTFLLAAAQLGREARGCELDTAMLAIARERGCVEN